MKGIRGLPDSGKPTHHFDHLKEFVLKLGVRFEGHKIKGVDDIKNGG